MNDKVIYTFGYTGSSYEDVARFLAATGAMLLDIRYSPTSMSSLWRKVALERAFPDRYRWIPELGNRNYRDGGPIELSKPDTGTRFVAAWMELGPVILMCACRDVETCHRKVAAQWVRERVGESVEIIHLPALYMRWRAA